MPDDKTRQRKRQSAQRKLSRREREARFKAGELDPELDFVCPMCNGLYSSYYGRHKLHLRVCERRFFQAARAPWRRPAPSPTPSETEVFPPAAVDPDTQDSTMEDIRPTEVHNEDLSLSSPSVPTSIGANPTVQRTLAMDHPYSHRPTHSTSTTDIAGPSEHTFRHEIQGKMAVSPLPPKLTSSKRRFSPTGRL